MNELVKLSDRDITPKLAKAMLKLESPARKMSEFQLSLFVSLSTCDLFVQSYHVENCILKTIQSKKLALVLAVNTFNQTSPIFSILFF